MTQTQRLFGSTGASICSGALASDATRTCAEAEVYVNALIDSGVADVDLHDPLGLVIGGAIYTFHESSLLNSTLHNNAAVGSGSEAGGIYNFQGLVTTGSTVSQNTAEVCNNALLRNDCVTL